jgi:hypothetical protein
MAAEGGKSVAKGPIDLFMRPTKKRGLAIDTAGDSQGRGGKKKQQRQHPDDDDDDAEKDKTSTSAEDVEGRFSKAFKAFSSATIHAEIPADSSGFIQPVETDEKPRWYLDVAKQAGHALVGSDPSKKIYLSLYANFVIKLCIFIYQFFSALMTEYCASERRAPIPSVNDRDFQHTPSISPTPLWHCS